MPSHDRTRHRANSRRDRPSSRSITYSRSRSRSPIRSKSPSSVRDEDRKRSRSHRRRDRDAEDTRDKRRRSHHRHRERRSSRKHEESRRGAGVEEPAQQQEPLTLPFESRQLTKRDIAHYEPVLGMYLDIQKSLIIEDLSEREIKGRWKSFMGKWNRGELAEGWYDPSTLEKARSSHNEVATPIRDRTRSPSRTKEPERLSRTESRDNERSRPSTELENLEEGEEGEDDEDDETYGPSLPNQQSLTHPQDSKPTRNQKSGPTIPKTEDLQIQRELSHSAHQSERSHSRSLHRQALSSHKSELKHLEEEVAPRAEPGTHERRVEKRQEKAAANRSFAQTARGGSPVAGVADDELMGEGGGGGGGDSLEAMKQEREKETRKKNDREVRREEILRARIAEREERMEAYRRKEDETMSVLKALAKQRFG